MKQSFYLLLIIGLVFSACQEQSNQSTNKEEEKQTKSMLAEPKQEKLLMGSYPAYLKNANIYEVNVRQYTAEGTFKAFETHIPRLKKMGVDVLWFMPVFPISSTKKKGSLGSYYAVSDFAKVNPEFGTLEEFRSMVKAIHKSGMKIILDFVPNHTGWDHVWLTDHKDYYTQDADGNVIDPIDPGTGESWGWTDVADLNYDNAEMRSAMINDMLYWVKEENIDGYRMDVAHNVPLDFWKQATEALYNAKQDLFMLAEAEVPELRNNKYFQVDYGWEMHHILNHIAKGEETAEDFKKWYKKSEDKMEHGFYMYFTSNHDENSWAGTTAERMGDAHDALAVLTYALDGMPLVYGGQEEPLQKRLEFFEKDDIGFGRYQKQEFYRRLNDAKHINHALWNGPFGGNVEFLDSEKNVLAFKRQKGDMKAAVIINLSDQPAKFECRETLGKMNNVIPGRYYTFKEGTVWDLDPWEAMLLSSI